MSYVADTLSNLIHQTAFFNLTWGNYLMIVVACVFLYLAIAKGFEPLLLVPIAFGMLLVNIYPDIMANPEDMSNGVGGLLHYFYILDEWSILPSLIFMGVGAMTDFGPLIANPKSFLMGAAAQLGIYMAYFLAIFLGFNGKAAAAISIIGGADGPTSNFLAGKLGQTALMGPIAVAAYSYMSLVPIIQPPIMKLFTTEKERKIKMEQLRPVSKLEKILFPIVITIVVCMILPTTAPLVGMLMLGNLFRECGVVKQLTETASNALMYIVVILWYICWCFHKCRGIPECGYFEDRCIRVLWHSHVVLSAVLCSESLCASLQAARSIRLSVPPVYLRYLWQPVFPRRLVLLRSANFLLMHAMDQTLPVLSVQPLLPEHLWLFTESNNDTRNSDFSRLSIVKPGSPDELNK